MFFNTDVLYKNGALALLWMVGNDEVLGPKSRRNKYYKMMITTNTIQLCIKLREYLPELGTAEGMSLVQISTLVRGLGIIQLRKIEQIQRDVMEIRLKMSRKITLGEIEIDLPMEIEMPEPMDLPDPGFAGEMRFEISHDADELRFPSVGNDEEGVDERSVHEQQRQRGSRHHPSDARPPERQRHRRRHSRRQQGERSEVTEVGVLEMLRNAVAATADTNLMNEVVTVNFDANADNEGFGFEGTDEMQLPLPNEVISTAGPENDFPTRNVESMDYQAPENPDVEGSPKSKRRRAIEPPTELQRLSQQSEQLQLEEIQIATNDQARRRQRRKVRRLEIDEEIVLFKEDLQRQIRAQPKPLNYEALEMELLSRLPMTRKIKTDQELLTSFGRRVTGSRLKEFEKSIFDTTRNFANIRISPRLPEISTAPQRQESQSEDSTGYSLEQQREAVSTIGVSRDNFSRDQQGEMTNYADVNMDYPTEGEHQQGAGAGDVDFIVPTYDDIPNVVAPGLQMLRESPTEPVAFSRMFPPGSVSRKKAASAFFHFLKLKGRGRVYIQQDEPFGELFITSNN